MECSLGLLESVFACSRLQKKRGWTLIQSNRLSRFGSRAGSQKGTPALPCFHMVAEPEDREGADTLRERRTVCRVFSERFLSYGDATPTSPAVTLGPPAKPRVRLE